MKGITSLHLVARRASGATQQWYEERLESDREATNTSAQSCKNFTRPRSTILAQVCELVPPCNTHVQRSCKLFGTTPLSWHHFVTTRPWSRTSSSRSVSTVFSLAFFYTGWRVLLERARDKHLKGSIGLENKWNWTELNVTAGFKVKTVTVETGALRHGYLVVRETWLLGPISPSMNTSPFALFTVYNHWVSHYRSASV